MSEIEIFIHQAGNTAAPALGVLLSKGFVVSRSAALPGNFEARRDHIRLCAEDPETLLGLAALVEARGADWRPTDAEVDALIALEGTDHDATRGRTTHVRRGTLANIAAGIASSFASRNNDHNGYWALGQLRSLAEQQSVSEFRIQLEPRQPTGHPLLDGIAARYASMLARLLENAGARSDAVVEAGIVVQLVLTDRASLLQSPTTWGEPLRCNVELRDASGRPARASHVTWCGVHDPANESRRARGVPSDGGHVRG